MSIAELEAKLIERTMKRADAIVANAEKEAKNIVSNASVEAKKIVGDAEKEAQRILEDAEKELKRVAIRVLGPEAARIAERVVRETELEGKRLIAHAKEDLISQVFSNVEEKVKRVVSGEEKGIDYHKVLVNLIKECASGIGEETIIVTSNKRDAQYIRENLSKIEKTVSEALGYGVKISLKKKMIDCLGGVVAYNTSGTKIYYNTLEGRILKLKREKRAEVADILFRD